MQIFERLTTFLAKHHLRFPLLRRWIAERQSRLPARTDMKSEDVRFFRPIVKGADESICAYFLSTFIPIWEKDNFVERVSQQAYRQRYQGKWKELQFYLENTTTPEDFITWACRINTPDAVFGTFFDNVERVLRRNRNIWQPAYTINRTKVKLTQRPRGYRDKGTLRPAHERGRIYGEDDPGSDRRDLAIDHLWSPDAVTLLTDETPYEDWVRLNFPTGKEESEDVDSRDTSEQNATN